jgi:DNA-binding transcriptional regulator YhcF (GntR family)
VAVTPKTADSPADDPRPPYVRTADALRKQIQDGQLAPGAKLPSARDLQAQYGIANSTAQNALRVLKEEGLIYSVQGRGVFVRQLSPRDQFLKRYNEGLEEMAAQRRADEEAVRLSGKSDDEVAAELAAAEERFAKASTEFEAATAHRRTGDTLTAASGVIGMCWLLLRQGRLDEAEHLGTVSLKGYGRHCCW